MNRKILTYLMAAQNSGLRRQIAIWNSSPAKCLAIRFVSMRSFSKPGRGHEFGTEANLSETLMVRVEL